MSNLSLREIAQSQLDSTPVIDGQLIVCLDTGNAYRDTLTAHVKIGSDLEVVSDLPLAPLAEKLYYLKPDKLYVFLGGNWTLLNDKTIDLDEAIAKLPAESSTTLNDDVEIITQDTDITQPHYYRRKLVVLWEYIKTKAQDFFAAKNHKHGKADITDFPTSMPASDVYPWAKATTKPSYTKAEIGLGKVDNTADADKTVKRATTAGTADSANSVAWENVRDKPTTFPVESHNHDDRYYTEAEVDGKLEGKSSTDHTHDLSKLISALSIGSSTTLNDTVQIITQGTDTDNQKYYRRPLSVLWDYIKSKADDVYSAIGHNHKIQNLEEYTTRVYDATIVRPADTVLASPQDKDGIATFRKLDKNDVGLENVDNTADKNKNVATAGIATTGVRDYNNANNIIEIGWSGADLDADSLAYVAGYTSDKKIHPASKDGVRMWLGLGDSAYKNTKSRSSKGSTDWTNNATDDAIVPTMSFMAYWDGAYNSNGASNLSYCDRGRFGTIVTKNTGDYAVAGHTHNSVNDIGDGRTTTFAYSKAGMNYGDYSWLAGWNGSELRAVDKNQFATAGHTHVLLNHQGNVTAISGTATRTAGLQLYGAYNNGYPATYGNVICASNGAFGSEIMMDCCGGGGKQGPGRMYYRNRSDWGTSEWSDWATVAYLTDKVAGANHADSATTSNGVKDYNDANRTIQIGYAGEGLNTSNLTHIAGYTDNGTKIKDVNKDVLTSWIGLGNYLHLGGGTMTGNIHFADIGDNASSAGITWDGSTDGASIYYQTTGADCGNLVLNLRDDNNCYLRIAQNGNFRSYFSPSDGNFHGNVNGTATNAEYLGNDSAYMRFHWSGQSGQPAWLWGGNDASNMYVWNPSNFNVNYATSAGMAGSANTLSGLSSHSSQGWGVQTGTFIHGEGDSTGGDFAFRRDCPNAGQMSMVIDGRFYQNKGQYRVLDESDKNQFATAEQGVTASGSNYVRFGDGTQICWGQQDIANSGTTITYAVAFSSIPAVVISGTEDIDDVFFVRNITTTNFVADKRGWFSGNNTWIAIGRWK